MGFFYHIRAQVLRKLFNVAHALCKKTFITIFFRHGVFLLQQRPLNSPFSPLRSQSMAGVGLIKKVNCKKIHRRLLQGIFIIETHVSLSHVNIETLVSSNTQVQAKTTTHRM